MGLAVNAGISIWNEECSSFPYYKSLEGKDNQEKFWRWGLAMSKRESGKCFKCGTVEEYVYPTIFQQRSTCNCITEDL